MADKFWMSPFLPSVLNIWESVWSDCDFLPEMLCGNLICTVHLPEGCSAVFNPGELSWLVQPFWVCKIAEVTVTGSAAVIWGLEGNWDAFGDNFNQKFAFLSMVARLFFLQDSRQNFRSMSWNRCHLFSCWTCALWDFSVVLMLQ